MRSENLTGREFQLRQFLPITTLLIAAVAGAEPAPTAAPAAGSSATHEVRDRASGQTMTCACRASGQDGMVCDQCAPTAALPRPTMRITGDGKYVSHPAWSDARERIQDDPRIRTLLTDLEVRLDGWKFEFALTCRSRPDDRRYVNPGLTMPLSRDSATRLIRGVVERECTEATAEQAPETTWAGCPVQDAYDRAGFNRTANPKIRITARPDAHGESWSALRYSLIGDDLIYQCSRELLIDPVSASEDVGATKFRANIMLTCANAPHRRGEFDTGVAALDAGTFRRFVGKELRRICGINVGSTASRPAR